MNTKRLLIALALPAFAAAAGAQTPMRGPGFGAASAAEVGILPKQKEEMTQKYLLDSEERNPFAKRIKADKGGPATVDTQSEEARIRAALDTFSISGISQGSSGCKAQLGSIILCEGEILPRLIPGQADDLRVTKITPELVEITWVADEEADRPRQVSLSVDLTAKVGVLMPTGGGKAVATSAPAGPQLVYQSDPEPQDD